jgi:quinol-cytochrome oxidoreductase complex cytochrome b subunit
MIFSPDWLRRVGHWIDDRLPLAFVSEIMREPIPGGARFSYVLGSATLYLCVLQVVTGVWQMFYYAPTVDHAYASVSYLRLYVPFGWLMHGLHYWGAQAFIVVMGLHVIRVFVWGAYKKPRELTWLVGVLLLVIGATLVFTGALLPWDMLGYWASDVGTSMAGTVPWVGEFFRAMLRGGATMGQLTLSRFFTLHVMILPAVLALLIVIHIVAFRQKGSAGPWNPERRRSSGPFWPDQVFKDLLVIVGMTIILVGLSAFLPAPFTGEADPLNSTHIPKPEWNFLFLYEAVKLFEGSWEPLGTIGLPTVLLLLLLSLPFIDRQPERTPWKRPVAMVGGFVFLAGVMVLTVLGGQGPDNAASGTAVVSAGSASQPGAEAAPNAQIELGKRLFATAGCVACHAINGQGGTMGPDLAGEAQKGRTEAWLITQLVSPKSHLATSMMPPTALAAPERTPVIAYLLSLEPASSVAAPAAPTEAPKLPLAGEQGPPGPASRMIGDVANGRVLFEGDCASCHGQAIHAANPTPAGGGALNLGQLGQGFFDRDPQLFADNIDRYIQHGARATGANPALYMPAFGDTDSLTQFEIANIEAFILATNGVDRAEIVNPGIAPATFFVITVVVLGGAVVLAFAGLTLGKAW